MKDFLTAALPWLALGTAIAVFLAIQTKQKEEVSESRMPECMCFGICLGVIISSFGLVNMTFGVSFGMLAGELIGMRIKKQ